MSVDRDSIKETCYSSTRCKMKRESPVVYSRGHCVDWHAPRPIRIRNVFSCRVRSRSNANAGASICVCLVCWYLKACCALWSQDESRRMYAAYDCCRLNYIRGLLICSQQWPSAVSMPRRLAHSHLSERQAVSGLSLSLEWKKDPPQSTSVSLLPTDLN